VRDIDSLESDYIHAEAPKPLPPSAVRVSRRSQLMAALRQNKHPIVIEDQDLAQPFVRLLRARDVKPRPLGAFVAEIASYAIRRSYGSDIEAHWYIGGYVLPGNVQKVILKSKALPPPPGHETISRRNALATRPVAALLYRPAVAGAPRLCNGRRTSSTRSGRGALQAGAALVAQKVTVEYGPYFRAAAWSRRSAANTS
jgi:hypothetical protein